MIWVPPDLRIAAERTVGGDVALEDFVSVVETFRGSVGWEGFVFKFTSQKGTVYGWQVEGWPVDRNEGPDYVTVLGQPPINTALDAVRAWLVSEARKKQKRPL